jgi:transposase-like protein
MVMARKREKKEMDILDQILDTIEWQNRPLEKSYAIVYLDVLRIKKRADKYTVESYK